MKPGPDRDLWLFLWWVVFLIVGVMIGFLWGSG